MRKIGLQRHNPGFGARVVLPMADELSSPWEVPALDPLQFGIDDCFLIHNPGLIIL